LIPDGIFFIVKTPCDSSDLTLHQTIVETFENTNFNYEGCFLLNSKLVCLA